METFSALLAICAGNSSVPVEFPAQRPVTRSFDVLFDLRLNKRLSKQSWGWWFETLSRPLWRHCNDINLWPDSGISVVCSQLIFLIRNAKAQRAMVATNIMVKNVHAEYDILFLTHWGLDKMDAISQTTLSNAFPEWKYLNFN